MEVPAAQYPEFGLQAFMTLLMLLTGRWLVGGLHLLVLAFNVRLMFLQQVRGVFLCFPRSSLFAPAVSPIAKHARIQHRC